MNKFKFFICGVVLGSLIAGGVSFASDHLQISVNLPIISYWFDGKEVTKDLQNKTTYLNGNMQVPTTIQYEGTSYVPVRFIADILGKEVEWDGKNNIIHIHSVNSIPFERVDLLQMPQHIQDWANQSLHNQMGQVRVDGDDTYILLTRGEKTSGGYDVQIRSINQYSEGTTVILDLSDPSSDELVTQPITYPYDLVRIRGKAQEPFSFRTTEGVEFPKIIGISSVPNIVRQEDGIALFEPVLHNDELILQGIVNAFEGVLQYSLYNHEGKQIMHETLQAQGGAPNWGYFQRILSIANISPGMKVNFRTFSPKDGSKLDELSVTLDPILHQIQRP